MVVCRFFQQGYCRFGQNCRFDHIYGSKYSYHANPPQQAASSQSTALQSTDYTDEQLVNQVQSDMQLALRGGQWILSCYAPFKEKALIPGISDLSPEEARLFIYEAKNSQNIEEAVKYMNNLFKETRQKYEQLLQPSTDVIKLLRSIYKGESVSSFSNTGQSTFSGANDSATSIFRKAVQNNQPSQNTAASVFSQGQQSIFNTQPDKAKDLFSNANNTSIFNQNSTSMNAFGPTNQTVAKSIFANAAQNTKNQFNSINQPNPSSIFSSANQSIFGPSPTSPQSNQAQNSSIFNQPQNVSPFSQVQNPSPFSQVQNTSPFNQAQNTSPFSQTQNSSPFSQSNVFQKTESPSSIFGLANNILNNANNPGVYSQIEELSAEDVMAFESDHFELGFVPELPPPQQLCTRV